MKKTIISITLSIMLLSVPAFADGDTPTGSRSCNGNPCLVSSEQFPSTKEDSPILKYVKDFFRLIF